MSPELFKIDFWGATYSVRSYVACQLLAALVVLATVSWQVVRHRQALRWRLVLLDVAITGLATLAGARASHVLAGGELDSDLASRLFEPRWRGFGLDGGLLAAAGSAWMLCRFQQIRFWQLADALGPVIFLAVAVTKLGCFLQGCCFGRETGLPWGVVFPLGSGVHVYQLVQGQVSIFSGPVLVHPTQIYDLLAAIAAAATVFWLRRRPVEDGTAVLAASLMFLVLRAASGTLRAIPSGAAIWELVLIGVTVVLLTRRIHRRSHELSSAGHTGNDSDD